MEGFTTQGCLNNHLYKNHNVVAPIRCTDCHRGFTYMSELKNHKNRFGKCPVPRDETEKQEIKMNPISAKYQCSLCSREYKHLRFYFKENQLMAVFNDQTHLSGPFNSIKNFTQTASLNINARFASRLSIILGICRDII